MALFPTIWSRFAFYLALIVLGLCVAQPSWAKKPQKPSAAAIQHAKRLAKVCPQNWEAQTCLKTASESAYVMLANYGAALKNAGHPDGWETLKEHCSASTAAMQLEDVPAYAMKSAYTTCANMIADLAEQYGISPDRGHFQLLVIPALCMDKTRAKECDVFEAALIREFR